MTGARESHRATLLTNGHVLVEAGWDGSRVLSSAELYDPTTGKFIATGSMSYGRFSAETTRLTNGQVLVAGGSSNTVELYDPGSGSFSVVGSMTSRRVNDTATLLPDGSVLIAGGDDNSNQELASALLWWP
jgi:WD40 repeat protein